MAVLGRLLISSAERLDLPDLLSLDSYAAGDFKYLLKGLVGDSKPFILRGFDIIDPQNAIGTQSCSIRVADSVVFYPGSNSGSFFHGLQEGHEQAAPLVPELRKNAVNYVYLTFSTFNTSVDTRAFWDPDKDGGAGGEFTQDVNTESVLKVDVNVSTGSFPQNTIPIAKVTVGPVVITAIEDARDMMFRLGAGGISPDPFNNYAWRSLPSSPYQRSEPPTQMLAGGINPFQGADKNIWSLKEWMDAVMSKLRELGGTIYWYEDTSTYSLISGFIDATSTAFKSKGKWQHDGVTPGLLTWTEDLHIKITSDPRTYIVRNGNKTLSDEQVMYVPMVRKQQFNVTDEAVDWINAQNYINTIGGAVGLFANLSKGDYVKKINDSNDKFLRVEEFYDSINLGGSTTTAANAKSVRLSGNYLGTTIAEKGRYDKGVYLAADVTVSDRNQATISNIGGNFHWLAMRSDTIQNVSNVVATALTIDITDHDGATAKVTSSGAHGLIDGDHVTIDNSTNFNGTYVVEVESATVFYINIAGGPFADELGCDAFYGTVTTASRSTAYGLQLESANHGFNTNDNIIIAGTTNFNGNYPISVRSATTFTIALPSAPATETTGTATLARMIVRTEGAVTQVVQGQDVNIGGTSADNIKQYVGMQSLSDTAPTYTVPPSYNTLDGMANWNSTVNENLTARVSKLTAMMADRAQDKTIKFLPSGYQSVVNTTNGAYQDITFNSLTPPPRLDIAMPGSDYSYGTVLLSGTLSLAANQAAYITVDRNATFSYASLAALSVADIVDVPVDENVFVLAIRLGTNEVWLWDGFYVSAGIVAPVPGYLNQVVQQNRMLKMVRGGTWSWNLITGQLTLSSDAYIQIPNLTEARNTILAQSIALANDGDVAYVDVNRSAGGATNLTVNVAAISSVTLNADRVIIARRIGNSVDVGTGTMSLVHGDSKFLDADDKVIKVRVVDIVNSTLPATPAVTIDGVSLANGDKVLFTNVALNGVYMVDDIGVGATWIKLGSFAGSDSPVEGALVSAQDGSAAFNTAWIYLSGNWKQVEHSTLVKEPTGFPNRTDSTISFDDITRTFSVTPVGTSFDIYQAGKPYRFTSAISVVIPNAEGLHYIYFNNGSLSSTQTFSEDLIKTYAIVGTVNWDASNLTGIMVGEERHGLAMDGTTHYYLHQALGVRWSNGLSLGNFTTSGTGALDSDAQMSVSDGRIIDEDNNIDIVDNPAPSNDFEQILDPIAEIPVYYRSGASGDWRKGAATTFPILYTPYVAPSVQISQLLNSSENSLSPNTTYSAQTFTTGSGFNLGSIEVEVRASAGASGSLVIEIWGMNAGQPDHTNVLGTSNAVAMSSLPIHPASAAFVSFTFPSPIALSSSTQYAFVVRKSGVVSGTLYWRARTPSPYSGGEWSTAPSPGTNGTWTMYPTYDSSFKIYDYGSSAGRIKYNNPAGPWTIPQASSDGNYVAMWLFATNNILEPVVAVLGQREDTTLNDAQANNRYETVLFGNLPAVDFKILYRLIFKTDSTYANTPKAALVDVRDLRTAADVNLGAYSPSDHGLLTGLTDQDHPDHSIYIEDPSTYVGGLRQIQLTDNDDVEKALNSLDRFFAQMRLRPHNSNPNRVVMSGADQALTNGITLTQNIKNLMVSFDGAQIDFSTGNIYKADGITALGINFTPAVITAGQYHWYSVTAIASSVNADNTINLQLVVLSATGDGATPTAAPKAAYAKGMQIGSVYVQESGGGIASITATNIKQLGTGGSGSGSGDGDANELLERIKDRVINAPFEWAEPNIFLTDEDDKIASATATFDVANTLYKFTGVGQNIVSIQSLDPEFLTEEKDVDSVELLAFWDVNAVDSNATYEVSRNGGTNWETMSMDRVGATTDTFRGILKFPQDTGYINLHEWALANATAYRELNATTLQGIGQKFTIASGAEEVLQRALLYINKVESAGTLTGTVYVQLVRDDGFDKPSTNVLDIVAQAQVLCSNLAVGDNAITLTWGSVLKTGTYHYVIATDSNYKTSFSAGVRSVRARVDAVGPIGPFGINELNAGVWGANAGQTLIHRIEGRGLDLRVRITSSASNVQLKGYGILYGRQEQVVTGIQNREVQQFDGTIDNFNEFTLTNFLPDPTLLKVYHVETGQVYLYGNSGFSLDGYKVTFPVNTFNGLGTVTLVFDQLVGTSFDNADVNAALLAANFLGSSDPNIDRSQNGRGIFLRRPDGTLREITIDNSDNIVVYSV